MDKEILADELIDIIQSNFNLLSDESVNNLNGVIHLMESLYDDYNEEIYNKDITVVIDTCIDVLTGIEDELSIQDKESFNDICNVFIINDLLSELKQGKLITYDNIPYIVSEIDFDDNSVHIFNGEIDDNGIWVDGNELLKIKF